MKTISCEDWQIRILERGDRPDPELAAHLENCPECRDFERFQRQVLAIPFPDAACPGLEQIRARAARTRLRVLKFLLPVAAAAAFAIGMILPFLNPEIPESALAFPAAPATAGITSLAEFGELNAANTAGGAGTLAVALHWDQAAGTTRTSLENKLAAAQEMKTWSIETFNPIEEEI